MTTGFRGMISQMSPEEVLCEISAETLSYMAATSSQNAFMTAMGSTPENYSDITNRIVYGATKTITKAVARAEDKMNQNIIMNDMDEDLAPYGMFGI